VAASWAAGQLHRGVCAEDGAADLHASEREYRDGQSRHQGDAEWAPGEAWRAVPGNASTGGRSWKGIAGSRSWDDAHRVVSGACARSGGPRDGDGAPGGGETWH